MQQGLKNACYSDTFHLNRQIVVNEQLVVNNQPIVNE